MDYDFSGYATRNDIQCSDGRVIRHGAFKDMNGKTVPLVWQHAHNSPENVLGLAHLETRNDGVYAYCSFNESELGQTAKEAVRHGDITSLSIFANQLVQHGADVMHGVIREVSLVLAGANPGAVIEDVNIRHSFDGSDVVDAIIAMNQGIVLAHADDEDDEDDEEYEVEYLDEDDEDDVNYDPTWASARNLANPDHINHADGDDRTVADVVESMTEEQKQVLAFLIEQAIDGETDSDVQHNYTDKDPNMSRNVFEAQESTSERTLSHSDFQSIMQEARNVGTFKQAAQNFLEHADAYGIKNIGMLFPDAKAVNGQPIFLGRRTEWVNSVLTAVKKSPFAKIKTVIADITADEARARGYVTGSRKKDEVFSLLKRDVTPTTIYKKQKLDRDDILDIEDMDVVNFIQGEMRLMLDEEIARAVMIGDGREISSEDKIDEKKIIQILNDDEMYVTHLTLKATDDPIADTEATIDAAIRARSNYRGSGTPTMYATTGFVADMLLSKDKMGRRHYQTVNDLAAALRVKEIIEVPVFEGVKRTDKSGAKHDLLAIVVNMNDYTVGATRGGQVSSFDDFDIDFNQYKYLIETRMSGMLTMPKSAIVIERTPKA